MAGITGAVQIKVDPQLMRSQAEEVRRLGTDMQNRFKELETIMGRTKNYWIGDAGDLHRKIYDERKNDIEMMLKRLREHPDDLMQISANYDEAERVNVSNIAPLPGDVIE